MSRGYGNLQRLILAYLETEANRDDAVPPLSWYTARAMGLGGTAAASSAYRRAVARLSDERVLDGLFDESVLEVNYVWAEAPSSRSAYYQRRRRSHVDRASLQGPRVHQVVRLAPTTESIEDLVSVERTFFERPTNQHRPEWLRWYLARPDGVYAADAPESSFAWAELERDVDLAYLSRWVSLARVPSQERVERALESIPGRVGARSKILSMLAEVNRLRTDEMT